MSGEQKKREKRVYGTGKVEVWAYPEHQSPPQQKRARKVTKRVKRAARRGARQKVERQIEQDS